MRRLPALLPIIVAALLALATYWLQFVVSSERPSGLGNDRGDPDAIVENFHVDKFDQQGKLAMVLEADELKHFPKDDSADLKQPRVRFLSAGRDSHWRSDKARVTERGDHIVLTENVRGVRVATAQSPEQVLTTTEVILLTDDEIAQIHQPLTVTQAGTRIDAASGEWNNIEGLLQLKQVDATLQRNP
ncbi:LPS export ABC transporter periplasmic protein LptC [Uliginosibacterium sp. H3]|uniref:LPS export ABC transporter periplasmic protein LptC n=1 Tax=Uliginosibacterium silvisoli TaxID=3114758 RepID=A0ABU6K5E1_9RHOO|nr:LPS export ABC transporter periplasmic protein LptC [Uliginosibacterium sp. H3]